MKICKKYYGIFMGYYINKKAKKVLTKIQILLVFDSTEINFNRTLNNILLV